MITTTFEDFQRLIAIPCDYDLPVQIGFEATGNYHRALIYQLGIGGFDIDALEAYIASFAPGSPPYAPLNRIDRVDG